MPGAAGCRHRMLRARALHYSYADTSVLTDINLTLTPGSLTALVGPNGAGKSTLLHLLQGQLQPGSGCVELDGRPIHDCRPQVALMPQEPFLFSDTLGANLAYDDPGRPRRQVEAAAGAADLAGTVDALPDGLDTPVGERGVMPGFAGAITDYELLGAVCYERYSLGGADQDGDYAEEFVKWCAEESEIFVELQAGAALASIHETHEGIIEIGDGPADGSPPMMMEG